MKKLLLALFCISFAFSESLSKKTQSMKKINGYMNLYWENTTGKLWLEISKFNEEFLYVNSLVAGMGSNDIGLDRGQLGSQKIVYFHRIGPKILLIQPNYYYRSSTKNLKEKESVADGFAKSTLWGFEIEAEENGKVLVNATSFFLQDSHNIISRLKDQKMGDFKVDNDRSAIFLPSTMNFPKNTEIEALITYTGLNPGKYVQQVTPTPNAITLRLHHSFVELPDKKYSPRKHDPRAGYFPLSFQDYSTDLNESIYIKYITRHRLEKKDPTSSLSEAKEPIIYYIDRGVPEPVKTAMLESGLWWNQAFKAAGYSNAFQMKVLPDNAHPMDVRYNMIHWVHRATRGWSYGGAVVDPRSGEIIKGNVSLGSLRLRQDYLIAVGLLAPYKKKNEIPSDMQNLALARVRQLVAHEIGHTLGLGHNFIASAANRASVMDYPHPTITLDKNNKIVWQNAYATNIGEWDKISIAYGYQDFPNNTNEKESLEAIIQNGIERGYAFITDKDARPLGSAHPKAHLWDNGNDATLELINLIKIRRKALDSFGADNIRWGQPYSDIEDVLVPIYLLHRYQIEGAVKLLGGLDYNYALKGDGQKITEFIDPIAQKKALDGLISTLKPDFLTLREDLLKIIPPRASGRGRTRESFRSRTGVTFDGTSLAETAAELTVRAILHPQRASRIVEHHARNSTQPSLEFILDYLIKNTLLTKSPNGLQGEVKKSVDFVILDYLFKLATNKNSSSAVESIVFVRIEQLIKDIKRLKNINIREKSHTLSLQRKISSFINNPIKYDSIEILKPPPGSPIGASFQCSFD